MSGIRETPQEPAEVETLLARLERAGKSSQWQYEHQLLADAKAHILALAAERDEARELVLSGNYEAALKGGSDIYQHVLALAVEKLRTSEARALRFSVPLAMFVKRIQANGEWDDGCFYYRGTSASELQEPLRLAHDAFVGTLAEANSSHEEPTP